LIPVAFGFFLFFIMAPVVPPFLMNSEKNCCPHSLARSSDAIVFTSAARCEWRLQSPHTRCRSSQRELIPVIVMLSAVILFPQSGQT
jgi:hypothetical protein